MGTALWWACNDLRRHDTAALAAVVGADRLLPDSESRSLRFCSSRCSV
ncbi:hypothetical protein Halar_1730 [halophilic archaeon DL31]|jgi:hypothetical protein|nr:hypothetical protein Halar_1730 [halophilic archaeon DL31]